MEFPFYRLKLVTAVVVILGFSAPSAQAEDWSTVFENSKASIPLLFMSSGYCSGALIEPDLILTAAHCVDRLRPVRVGWADSLPRIEAAKDKSPDPGNPAEPTVAFLTEGSEVVAMDRDRDLALLRLKQKKSYAPLKLATSVSRSKIGEPIVTIGHPARRASSWGSEFLFEKEEVYLLSSGVVSGLGQKDLLTDVSLTPGNSGGPVLNRSQEIVGVVSRKRIGPAVGQIGFAAHADSIREFREEHQKNGDKKFLFWHAGHNSKLSLLWASSQVRAAETESRSAQSAYRLDIDLWDRLRLNYSSGFSRRPYFESYGVGWKFQYLMSDLNIWNFVPGIEVVEIAFEDRDLALNYDLRKVAASAVFESSHFPLNFKLIYAPGQNESILTGLVGLPLF